MRRHSPTPKAMVAAVTLAGFGVFWVVAAALAEGSGLLYGPGVADLLAAIVLLAGVQGGWVRALVLGASLYNIPLLGIQVAASWALVQASTDAFSISSLVGYALALLLAGYLALMIYTNPNGFGLASRSGEGRKRSRRTQ